MIYRDYFAVQHSEATIDGYFHAGCMDTLHVPRRQPKKNIARERKETGPHTHIFEHGGVSSTILFLIVHIVLSPANFRFEAAQICTCPHGVDDRM